MKDPVNNFEIPPEWIERSRIQGRELEEGIHSGKLVLLSTGEVLHRGYTTGTTAAAASKAAVLSLKKYHTSEVNIMTPIGITISVPVRAENGKAVAIKYSGDHGEDVTSGIDIIAEAKAAAAITFAAGEGIGTASRDVFYLKKGEAAINPAPRKQILTAIKEALKEIDMHGVEVLLTVPSGRQIAEHTINGKLGIQGGISILGTTGFVEPWNEHLQASNKEQIKNAERPVLTTGRRGMRYAHMLFPDRVVILIGSGIEQAVETSREYGKKTILCGLPALILKWANPQILTQTEYRTVTELIEKDSSHPVISESINVASKKYDIRIVIVDGNGTQIYDTGGTK